MVIVSELAAKFDFKAGKKYKILPEPKYVGSKETKVRIPGRLQLPSTLRTSLMFTGEDDVVSSGLQAHFCSIAAFIIIFISLCRLLYTFTCRVREKVAHLSAAVLLSFRMRCNHLSRKQRRRRC
ncbi:hypothetical protein EON64_14660 [archaeon]|nr:MAG: hypothetical protein EON64_14660 [archaeon]